MTKNKSHAARPKIGHKQHPKHFVKVYWPYIPIIVMVVTGMVLGVLRPQNGTFVPQTLAYATEMSTGGLLSATNSHRANHGKPALTINSQLNASAQAKAADMSAKDYWAHNAPDGSEPWVFFNNAGYSYQKAGENLAYGFSTSPDVVIGWMNSPSHRANMLDGTYEEVGFGFVNAENFVGNGQQTIVVAHYATPIAAPAPAPVPATAEPAAVQSVQQEAEQPVASEPATAVPTSEPVVEEEPEPVFTPIDASRINQPVTSERPVPTTITPTRTTVIQQLTGGNAPWSAFAVVFVALGVTIVWIARHALLVKRFVWAGEHFVAHHPFIDLTVIAVVALAIYLTQTAGVVL